jgi:hypothetical protein
LAVLDEDEEKLGRVRSLAATIGLPILDTLVFRLPSDANHLFHAISKQLEGGWNVSFRVMNEDSGALVFRDLDVDVKAVKSELSKLPSGHKFRASISPYKPASISGTLLVRPDDLVLEIVYGPHFWLTKSLPDGVQMFRCCYTAPDVSVRYSTGDAKHRAILHRHLEDITRLALGLKQVGQFMQNTSGERISVIVSWIARTRPYGRRWAVTRDECNVVLTICAFRMLFGTVSGKIVSTLGELLP